jgi:hypothetical protein
MLKVIKDNTDEATDEEISEDNAIWGLGWGSQVNLEVEDREIKNEKDQEEQNTRST